MYTRFFAAAFKILINNGNYVTAISYESCARSLDKYLTFYRDEPVLS